MGHRRNRNGGPEQCPDCGGIMANTLDPKRIICPECGAIIELARMRRRI
ncbi:MAG: hypothetical protein LUQ09_05075 [Methanomassiliicoccales archaeon]|nr:hypothetical protein [Methanomassiliicoccales archaeon]